jgi:uncharacterized protein YegP (UPF0339 family)
LATNSPSGRANGSFRTRACASSIDCAGISTIHSAPSWKYSNRNVLKLSLELVMAYYMYRDSQNQWRWRFVAANNRVIAVSSEAYHNETDCRWSINLIKGSGGAPVYTV